MGGEWTVRHTAVDFELLSSCTELGLCVSVYMCIYTYLGLVLNVSHPGAGRKKPVQSSFIFNNIRKCALARGPHPPFFFKQVLFVPGRICCLCNFKTLK